MVQVFFWKFYFFYFFFFSENYDLIVMQILFSPALSYIYYKILPLFEYVIDCDICAHILLAEALAHDAISHTPYHTPDPY